VILVADDRGHVAVPQAEHAAMCAELGRAWGNERFGAVEPRDEVCLAAERHELGWMDWERAPTLNPATGLPHAVLDLDMASHLPMQLEGPRRLADESPYAGLLALRKHMNMYSRPAGLGLLRTDGRRLRAHLDESAALEARLRSHVSVPDAELDRNWRLVRTWDGLSHDLLLDRAPRTRHGVPSANGAVDLSLERSGDGYRLDPWPFATERVVVHARGRLLEETFTDERRMRDALAHAPEVVLSYELAE
jgi:hypothetical protein